MKTFLLFSLTAAVSSTALSAATLYDFNALASDGSVHFSNAVAGWTQSTTNPTFDGADVPLAYIDSAALGGSVSSAGYLGTIRGNLVPNAPTTLTGTLNTGTPTAITGNTLSIDISFLDDAADSFTSRDSFSIGITNSLDLSVASLSFNPNGGDANLWDVSFEVGGIVTNSSVTLSSNTGYRLFVDFLDTSVQFGYGSTTSSSASTYFGTSSTTAAGTSEFGNLLLTHTPNGAAGSSANALVFDNVAINPVPEPSAALLLGVSALGLFRRNRRN